MRLLLSRILFFFFVFYFFPATLFSQASYWMLKGGGITADEGIDICLDNSGNTITTGYFSGTATFGNETVISSGVSDIFIVKTNSNGSVLWARSAGGFGPDKGLSVKADIYGNCYVTGFFYGTASFSGTQISSSVGSQDMFLAKYDGNGNFLWVVSGGGKLGDMGNAVTTDRYDNVFVTGQFTDTAQFSGITLVSMQDTSFQSSIDAFIVKYNSDGNLLWIKKGSAVYTDRGMDIVTDTLGNVYTLGQFSDTISFANTYNNNSYNATFLLKCDSSGTELWFRRMGGSSQNIAYGLAIDNSSNVYITGDCAGNIIFFGPSNFSFNAPYNYNIYVAKYNSAGDFLWFTTDGSSSQVSSRNIALDLSGNPFIVGNFRCIFSQYSDFFGEGTFNSIGFRDVFVTKYNSSGTRQWMRQCGGQKDDFGSGIAVNSSGKAIITGTYRHKMLFPGLSNFTMNTVDGIANSASQSSYCSDLNYGKFYFLDSIGNADIFIANAIDSLRQPYDYYKRSVVGCNRDFIGCCIHNFGNGTIYGSDKTCSSDSIDVCDSTILTCASNTSSTSYFQVIWTNFVAYSSPGPIYNFLWSTGDTTRNISVNATGTYSVTMNSIDGCFQSSDTIFVKIHPSPPKPSISDDVVINSNSFYPLQIDICTPDSVLLTGGNTGNFGYYWTGPGLPASGLNQLSISVKVTGTYYFFVEDSFGCKNFTFVYVNVIPFPPIFPKIYGLDSVSVCEGDNFLVCIYDSLISPPGCTNIPNVKVNWSINPGGGITFAQTTTTSYNYFYPIVSGLYNISAVLIRNTVCGIDTHFLNKLVYVTVNPDLIVNISGNNLLCPSGDTITLSANTSGGNYFHWYGNGISSNIYSQTVEIFQQGVFQVLVIDTLTGCNGQNSFQVNYKPQPDIIKNPSNGIICPGDSVFMTVNLSGISYQWYGPGGMIAGANSQNYSDSVTGFYYCVVVDSDSCELVSNSVELKQYATPFLIVSPVNMICPGGNATLEVITNDGSLLNWWAPLSGSQLIKTVYSPGTYTCSVTSCNISTTVSTDISMANPVAQISLSDSGDQCMGDSVILYSNPGMAQYEWSSGSQNPLLVIFESGSFSLSTTDNNGCIAVSQPVSIIFLQIPDPPVVSSDTTVCSGESAEIFASSPYTVEWFDTLYGGSIVGSGYSFITPPVYAACTFFAQSGISVCSSSRVTVNILVDSASMLPVISSNSPVCSGDTIFLFASFVSGANYMWSGPDFFSSPQQNNEILAASASDSGKYTLVTLSSNCTSDPETLEVIVISPPPVPEIFSNSPLCEGDTLFLSTDSLPGVDYYWSGPGNFTSNFVNPVLFNVTPVDSGYYHLYITQGDCESEEKFLTVNITGKLVIPGAGNNSPFCPGDTLFLFADTIDNAVYFWDGPNSFSSMEQNPFIANANSLFAGQYSVFAARGNCSSDTIDVSAIIFPSPFVFLGNDTVICNNSKVTLDAGGGFSEVLWQNGFSGQSFLAGDEGIYFVMVTDKNGCTATDSINIKLSDCGVPFPRFFSPNGDGENDFFKIVGTGLKDMHVIIFNRWGQVVCGWDGAEGSWDGLIVPDGVPAPEGVYFYVVEFTDFYDSHQENKGYFHLFR